MPAAAARTAASTSSKPARTPAAWAARAWPLPALVAWCLAGVLALGLQRVGWPAWAGWGVAALPVLAIAFAQTGALRRALLPLGLLAMALLLQPDGLPAWVWLLALLALWLLYPLHAWRDAPWFPTPAGTLQALPERIALPQAAQVLDAGCGLGHGLRELHRVFGSARIHGIEWSRPLALLARLGCPWATVRRGDLWAADWSGFDLVYLFQRPESMRRAHDKALAEMRPGSWLVSLEFTVPGVRPDAMLPAGRGRRLALYRMPGRQAPDPR